MLGASDFVGHWRLERRIEDRLSGLPGYLSGTARLSGSGDELTYDETGDFRIGDGPAMVAQRRYLWRFLGTHVDVRFADGAPFHSFVPAGRAAGTDHPCGADFYQVRYDFENWPNWQATWTVRGPRKDYTSTSDYSPQEP